MKVEYSSNNSGGDWWLKDADWKKLERAGWYVEWGKLYFCHSAYSINKVPDGKPEPCADSRSCHGHRRFESADDMKKDDRWLGALASSAWKDFPSLADGIREWEEVLGETASEEGCGCCGPPHFFKGGGEYASGEDIVWALNPKKKRRTLREMVEEEQ